MDRKHSVAVGALYCWELSCRDDGSSRNRFALLRIYDDARTKYRKAHKGRIHGRAGRGQLLNYGAYGLKAMEPERIISKQIEAARVSLTRFMKRTGKVWLRIFPNIPVSKKPTEVRMGKGKGSPEYWICRVKPGKIIFEVDGISEAVAREALYKASTKLPIKTKFVKRY